MAKTEKLDRTDDTSTKARQPLRLLVIRHAIAEEVTDIGHGRMPDAERELTPQGRRKMRQAARGLIELVPNVRVLASSPLSRAVQTADIISKQSAKSGRAVETSRLSALSPGRPNNLLMSWLAQQSREGVVAIVGHEPNLSQFISWSLTGLRDSFLQLKKGAACLLEFNDEVKPSHAVLLWSLRPGQLRAIGRGTAK